MKTPASPLERSLGLSLVLSSGALALGAIACNGTGGAPIAVGFAVAAIGDGRTTTPSGWEVALSEAVITVEAVHVFAPPDEPAARTFLPLVSPSRARAHGGAGLSDGRAVRAEMLERFTFDAIATERTELGTVAAWGGAVDEMTLWLAESPDNARATGHSLWVRGTARRGGEHLAFEGALALRGDELERRIEGIPVTGPPLQEGATILIEIDPSRWLEEADFSTLVAAGPTVEILPESQPHRAWRLGARSSGSYRAGVLDE